MNTKNICLPREVKLTKVSLGMGICILIVIFSVTLSFALTIREGHPRIYLNSITLPEIRARQATTNKAVYLDVFNGASGIETNFFSSWNANKIAKAATVYAIGNIDGITPPRPLIDYATKAKNELISILPSLISAAEDNPKYGDEPTPDIYLAYDYLYPILTASERKTIVDSLIRISDALKTVTEHRADNNSFMPGAIRYTIAGLAFSGDGANIGDGSQRSYYESKSQEYINDFSTIYYNIMRFHNWLGLWSNGPYYAMNYPQRLILVSAAFDSATTAPEQATSFTDFKGYWYNWMEWMTWRRPLWGDFAIMSDCNYGGSVHSWLHGESACHILSYLIYKGMTENDLNFAGLSKYLIERGSYTKPEMTYTSAYTILWGNVSTEERTPEEVGVPTTKLYNNVGWTYMSSGHNWENRIMATFAAQPYYFGNHDHVDNNSFQIFRKGALAIESGMYENGDGTNEERNYNSRTISSNSMLIYDPDENFIDDYGITNRNDGGQKYPYPITQSLHLSDLTQDSPFYTGGTRRFKTETDYDYVFGDATKSYSANKLENFTRQFIFWKPETADGSAYFVVFDRVKETTQNFNKNSPSSSKRWLLHTKYVPEFSTTPEIINDVKKQYGSVASFKVKDVENYAGRQATGVMEVKVLAPDNFVVNLIGGPGHEYAGWDGNESFSTFWSPKTDLGSYRVEVEPSGTSVNVENQFLVVFKVNDEIASSMDVRKITGSDGSILGCHIIGGATDYVSVFSKNEGYISTYSYQLASSNTVKHLICDALPNSSFDVYKNGTKTGTLYSGSEAVLSFTSNGGGSFLLQKTGSPPPHEISSPQNFQAE